MEMITVVYLPLAGYQKFLPSHPLQKQKSPLFCEWAKVSYCFSLQCRPSHKFVWPAKSISKPAKRNRGSEDAVLARIGKAVDQFRIALSRASVFLLALEDNDILPVRVFLRVGHRAPDRQHFNTTGLRSGNA